MTEASEAPEEEALAFLRDLIDRYGVQGLTERLGAAIEEAEAGRVAGPALDEAAAWLEDDQGPEIVALIGEGRLTTVPVVPSVAAMFSGLGTLSATAEVMAEGIVPKVSPDVVTATDQAAVTVTEAAQVVVTADLPANLQVLAQVHDAFLYLVGLWGLLEVPVEAVPFILLMALAIVVVRIRLKRD
jgi:hypothetical protein